MNHKYEKLARLQTSRNMLYYLIQISKTCDKDTKLSEVSDFLVIILDLINFEL